MSNEPKANNDAQPELTGTYADWARQLVENLVEAERKWLELASQQNELAMKAIRQGLEYYRTAPNASLADWARQGVENFVEAQRRWTEAATRQSSSYFQQAQSQVQEVAEGATEGTVDEIRPAVNFMQQQVDALAETRRRWLDFVAKQNAQVVSGVKQGMGVTSPAATYADWAQQAVDNYVQVQKRWLDLATQLPFQRRNSR